MFINSIIPSRLNIKNMPFFFIPIILQLRKVHFFNTIDKIPSHYGGECHVKTKEFHGNHVISITRKLSITYL